MAIAANGDVGLRPVSADAADQPAQMAADLRAGRRLAGPQQHRYRAGGGGVVDMDRQKAALVVMGVEERKLLVAMDDIEGVVDVERDRRRRGGVAGAIEIDHDPHQADQIAQGWCVLPARDGRLRAQVDAAVGQPSTGELEPRIGAQPVEIIGVFVAAGDCQNPGPQNIGQSMDDPARIALVRDHGREPRGDAEPPLGLRQQHDAAIRGDPAAVNGGSHLLARYGWKRERQQAIVGHGGCGALQSAARIGFSNQILAQINSLRYTHQPKSARAMNKTG
jgi:hypothetical protein